MKVLLIVFVLACALYANGLKADDVSNKDMFLRIIECAHYAVINGIPEIGLPSHEPLKISRNFSTEMALGPVSIQFALENMVISGIPWWNVTQMDDKTVVETNPIFDYTIYWKEMAFDGQWRLALATADTKIEFLKEEGTLGFELDHLTFAGRFDFSKPGDAKKEGFNDLSLHLHTEESELHIDGLGVLSKIIDLVGGPAFKTIFNLDLLASKLGPGIRDKFNRDWISKPERVEAVMSHCPSGGY